MDDLKKPMHQISGLATRAQLDEWILEYDRIEKETETFDSGDLKKLKKFTKGMLSFGCDKMFLDVLCSCPSVYTAQPLT